MGKAINVLRRPVEFLSKENRFLLRVGGLLISTTVILASGFCGWIIERIVLMDSFLPQIISYGILLIALTSALAARSLRKEVEGIITTLDNNETVSNLIIARKKLQRIVGRDVSQLDKGSILRAAAESASENSVDGIFAPLFWMLVGSTLWLFNTSLPGPLAFAWIFKASSTLDSMLGYRQGKLRWLGTASAVFDDIMVWIPCRLVVITLPIVSQPFKKWFFIIKKTLREGSKYESPNAGLSEAIFAHCADIRMGGVYYYQNQRKDKHIIAAHSPNASENNIKRLFLISFKLQILWSIIAAIFSIVLMLIIN